MIIIGYPGIGKSSKCGANMKRIDLESTFFHEKNDRDWARRYVQVALDLCSQGYDVFVSSHLEVVGEARDQRWVTIHDNKFIPRNKSVVVVTPSPELEAEWIKKLEERWHACKNNDCLEWEIEKCYRALVRAKERYTEDVNYLIRQSRLPVYVIDQMDYDLDNVIEDILVEFNNNEYLLRGWVETLVYSEQMRVREVCRYFADVFNGMKKETQDDDN